MRNSLMSILLLATVSAVSLAACGPEDREDGAAAVGQTAPLPTGATGALSRASIEKAILTASVAQPTPPASSTGEIQPPVPRTPDAGMIRLQILLDRTAFSPGIVDGLHGENVRQAIAAWRKANDVGTGDVADETLLSALVAADTAPVTTDYVITAADVAGPFSPPPSGDMKAQAVAGTHYSTPLEGLAERFHMSEALMTALNPGTDFARAGQRIVVAALNPAPLAAVARIVVDKSEKAVRAYDADDTLIAFYPATIGSSDNPSPAAANLTVKGVARAPDYTYDPSRLTYGPGGDKVIVPAGPNNPVGAVWIDLSRDTYGIHGTPDPSKIGKSASHGCVRLTNWDAQQLATAVKPGVRVQFR